MYIHPLLFIALLFGAIYFIVDVAIRLAKRNTINHWPEVDEFALEMKRRLHECKHRYEQYNGKKWPTTPTNDLTEEILAKAYTMFKCGNFSKGIKTNAIDAANYAMMVWDNNRIDKCQCQGRGQCSYCVTANDL